MLDPPPPQYDMAVAALAETKAAAMQSMNNGRGAVVDSALNAAGNRAVQAVHPLATHSNMVGWDNIFNLTIEQIVPAARKDSRGSVNTSITSSSMYTGSTDTSASNIDAQTELVGTL